MKRSRINPISAKRREKLVEYARIRAVVLVRDKGRCRLLCGRAATDTHHILYRSQGGPDETWNLISLCRWCHDLVHSEGPEKWRATLHQMAEATQ